MASRSKLTPRALRELERLTAWWRGERPSAPDLLLDELEAARAALEASPRLGILYAGSRSGTRRFLLTQTRVHVYYAIRGEDLVVLSLWSALRRRGPKV